MSQPLCAGCTAFMLHLLDKRIRAVLAAYAAEGGEDTGGATCFHFMEIKNILEGKKTSGVYDDYGDPPTIKGPLFQEKQA